MIISCRQVSATNAFKLSDMICNPAVLPSACFLVRMASIWCVRESICPQWDDASESKSCRLPEAFRTGLANVSAAAKAQFLSSRGSVSCRATESAHKVEILEK
jgi:hypothetical protein